MACLHVKDITSTQFPSDFASLFKNTNLSTRWMHQINLKDLGNVQVRLSAKLLLSLFTLKSFQALHDLPAIKYHNSEEI